MQPKYIGDQTLRSLNNFTFPCGSVQMELIYAIAKIKKAAASANARAGLLDAALAKKIGDACDKIINQEMEGEFPTKAIQGGAGTSINMNVNEVIANYVSAMASGINIHPNDHVNMSQSTNDVNPSALKITCLDLGGILLEKLSGLVTSLESKAHEFEHVVKLGRTHIQDAVPTTLGEEFRAYASIISVDKKRITQALEYMNVLNLGGTAIGNSVNATKEYIAFVYEELSRITGREFKPARSMMAQTGSQSDFCHLSAAINLLCLDLSKISTDIRFMASGPKGGIGEIFLEPLQNGSSIMPGKINPVIPESINQVYFYVQGKNLTIHEAAHNAHLELAIMFPILADSLISMLKMTSAAIEIFEEKCLRPMKANEERCKELLESSMAYATLLVPKYGYEKVSEIVRFAIRERLSLREAAAKYGIVDDFGAI